MTAFLIIIFIIIYLLLLSEMNIGLIISNEYS